MYVRVCLLASWICVWIGFWLSIDLHIILDSCARVHIYWRTNRKITLRPFTVQNNSNGVLVKKRRYSIEFFGSQTCVAKAHSHIDGAKHSQMKSSFRFFLSAALLCWFVFGALLDVQEYECVCENLLTPRIWRQLLACCCKTQRVTKQRPRHREKFSSQELDSCCCWCCYVSFSNHCTLPLFRYLKCSTKNIRFGNFENKQTKKATKAALKMNRET